MRACAAFIVFAVACGPGQVGQQMCTERDVGGSFCVPDSGRAANIDVKLQLRDDCTSGCDQGSAVCVVRFDGGTSVELALVGVACFDPNTSCPAVCGMKTYDCKLPAMPDGTYTVQSQNQASQQLTVGPGGAAACALP